VFVQSVHNRRQLLRVSFAAGPRISVGRQVEHPEPVEHQPDHNPFERVLDPLFRLVPPAAHLDRRLSVEHAQLVSCE